MFSFDFGPGRDSGVPGAVRRAQGARQVIQDIAVELGCLLVPKLWVSLGVKKRGRGL